MRSLNRFLDTASPTLDFDKNRDDPFLWACYVAWIAKCGNCADTARFYLTGMQTLFSEIGIIIKPLSMPLVKRTLKGLQREPRSTKPAPKRPITVPVLHHILPSFSFSSHEDRTIWAMMSLATYGLLRCGEVTLKPKGESFPLLSDWKVSDDKSLASYYLPTSKSDTNHLGTTIYVASNSSPSCPVSAMHQMITRLPFTAHHSSPLFSLDGYHPISRYVFLKRVRKHLTVSGFNAEEFSGHSFRRGGAQSAYDTGLTIDDLQLLGRWRQPQVAQRYYRFTQQRLSALSHKMATISASNPLRFELLIKDKQGAK